MSIPAFDATGRLPSGIHDSTLEDAEARFGSFRGSDRRPHLWEKLQKFVEEARKCGLVEAIVINGSFVTEKPEPNDIDLILVVKSAHDFSADLQPSQYNVLSKRRVHRRYGFDLLAARDGSEELRRYCEFFQQVRFAPGQRKGIVRLHL